ncbi:hypothetical protein ACP4OV_023121 [Aristida adscensionis]
MNYYPDPAGPWCYPDNAGDAAAAAATDDSTGFAYMSRDYSTDDLFDLVWRGGGGGGGRTSSELEHRAVSLHLSPPPPAQAVPEALAGRPSQDEMTAWLCAIVKDDDQEHAGSKECSSETSMATRVTPSTTETTKEKLVETEGMTSKDTGSDIINRRCKMTGESKRSRDGSSTHRITEKRRRYKIKERLETLQQLVPGCDKQLSHASTLDQTIRYLKSLQRQVQAMSACPPAAYAVVLQPPQYVPPAAPMVLGYGAAPAMVPLGPAMLPCSHYPAAVMVPAAPAPAPLHPAAGRRPVAIDRGRAEAKATKGKGSS